MKSYLILFLMILPGCAAFTKRTFIEIANEKKIDHSANNSSIAVGELVFEKDDYNLKVINRNSNVAFLSIGPIVPIIPFELFSKITGNGRLVIDFLLIPHEARAPSPTLDFSSMAFESVPEINNPCERYSIKEIIKSKGDELEFFDHAMTSSKEAPARLFQLDCRLPGHSTPDGKGPFFTIKGIRVVDSKATFTLPDLVVTYKRSFNYEFFSP